VNLINKKFKTLDDLNEDIFEELLALSKMQSSPCFILSGGNSPRPLFRRISQHNEYFKKAIFVMSDERVIDIENSSSNEGEFLRLSNIAKDNLISLRNKKIIQKLNDISSYDLAVLGMGDDGHFASIFPDCLNTFDAINSQNNIISFEDEHLDFERISLSLNEILKAKKIILIASSKNKQSILSNNKSLPVHHLLNKSPDKIFIFSCD
jgi:6-phosphogluconolactonase